MVGLWAALGCYEAVQTHTHSVLYGRPLTWSRAFKGELEYAMLAACLTPGILWLAGRFQLPSRRWLRVVAAHAAGAATFSSIAKLCWDVVYQPSWSFFAQGISAHSVAASVVAGFESGVLLYCIVVSAAWAYSYYRTLQLERLAASELQRQFASAQLQALRMQLQPHFLFNTLHTISGLIDEDKSAAERMIARLSDFLRMSLEAARAPVITLRDELRFVRLYLDIEHVRFEDRLSVDFEIDLATENALVPAWILQPLVENAIRHGVAHREFDARITVRALRAAGELVLSVEDNGPGNVSPPPSPGSGLGLVNTRARLETLYGPNQQLHLLRRDDGGAEARVVLPYTSEGQEEVLVCAS